LEYSVHLSADQLTPGACFTKGPILSWQVKILVGWQ